MKTSIYFSKLLPERGPQSTPTSDTGCSLRKQPTSQDLIPSFFWAGQKRKEKVLGTSLLEKTSNSKVWVLSR